MTNNCLRVLEGKVLKKIDLNEDRDKIVFTAEDKQYNFSAWGDCCSKSWIESIIGSENIINQRIIKARLLLMDKYYPDYNYPKNEYYEEYITTKYKVFGFQLVSNQGHCDFIMYNASNGYYSGDLYCDNCEFSHPVYIDTLRCATL